MNITFKPSLWQRLENNGWFCQRSLYFGGVATSCYTKGTRVLNFYKKDGDKAIVTITRR